MSGDDKVPPEESEPVDSDESPFEGGPIEGIPFKRGSVEDHAIKRILARKAARERGEPVDYDSPFEGGPTEGTPYKRGSVEDLAIKRILARKAARERAQDESSTAT